MRYLTVVFGVFFAALAVSGEIVVNPYDTTVTPGVWCGNFASAKSYAEKNDCPMVLFWGKDGCGHCATLKSYLGTQSGLNWAASKNTTVFCLVEGTQIGADRDPNQGARDFAMGWNGKSAELMYTPFVCMYWPNRKLTRFSGWSGVETDPTMTLAEFQSRYDDFVKDIVIDASFTSFPFGDHPCDRLEAVVGETTFVEVPVVRTNAQDKTAVCKLNFTYGGTTKSESMSWSASETRKSVRYTMPSGVKVGDQITVALAESAGTVLSTRHIWCVGEVENSPKNPYWIGERTASTLDWGEWTMDLDVATQKVSSVAGAATLVLVGGSLWCPDCYSTDAYLIDTPEFKTWAKDNKIACVAVDVTNPHSQTANTSLLTWDSTRTSDRYVTCNYGKPADENLRYESGAGYLSRHEVTMSEAATVAARNKWLLNNSTLVGGLCRPEDLDDDNEHTGPFKTGIPCLIAFRPNGTIAGRIYQFNNVSASNTVALAGHIARLTEMFTQGTDVCEEDNDAPLTTQAVLSLGEPAEATVSAVDSRDYWQVKAGADTDLHLTLAGTADAEVTMHVTDESGQIPVTLAETTGRLSEGIALSVKTESSFTFVRIGFPLDGNGYATDGYFAFTNTVSTRAGYVLTVTDVPSGGEIGFVTSATNVSENCGTVPLTVSRTRGSSGSASVKVKLVGKTGEGVDSRIAWTDTTLAWANGESGEKTAVLTILDDEVVRHDMRLSFALEELQGEVENLTLTTDAMKVNVYDDEVFGVPAYRFVQVDESRPITYYTKDDAVTITLASGKVPEGVVVTEENGQLRVTGTVSGAAGSYSAVYRIVCEGSVHTPTQEDMTLEFTVTDYDFAADIPSLATTRTYDNLPKIVHDGDNALVAGLLTITVPANGQLSAKYVTEDQMFAYAAEGWKSFDLNGGSLTAELFRTDAPEEILSVTLTKAGGTVQFADPVAAGTLTFELPAEIWPKGAAAYRGQYTVQMPQTNIVDGLGENARAGAAYMALRMNSESAVAAGAMLYAGVLPNGRSFYACRTLAPDCCNVSDAVLPFYHFSDMKTSGYVFSGGLSIQANAETLYKSWHWSVHANYTCVWTQNDARGHESVFNVYGGYYDQDEIYDRFQEDFSGQLANFAFQVESSEIDSGRYGIGGAFTSVRAEITSDNTVRLVDTVANPHEVELSFSKETGVVSGSLYLPFEGEDVAVTFRGIVLPGWQGCGTCTTGSFVERPWAVGACSFSDRIKGGGTYRNGCAVSLDRIQ